MLTSTFIHAQGIGPTTEQRIWHSGITDWRSFIDRTSDLRLPARQVALLSPVVEESISRFEAGDYTYFAGKLKSREHWRAFGELGERAAYVDIETTGMAMNAGITVIGLYNGIETKTFVKGFNLEEFVEEVEKYPLLVTYAGSMFDLPHLRHAFPGTKLDQLHLDLCPTLRRIGYKGGLKSVEEQLGIARCSSIKSLDGWDAVRLWKEWEWGSRESLDLLIEYNRADVENLKWLAEFAYRELRSATLPIGA